MSILRDLIEKKAQQIVDDKIEREQQENKDQSISDNNDIMVYNRHWLLKTANKYEFQITDNEPRALNILKKLNQRDGHCPCGGMTDEFICPCKMMREFGHCKCGLYESAKDINPKGSTSAQIKRDN